MVTLQADTPDVFGVSPASRTLISAYVPLAEQCVPTSQK